MADDPIALFDAWYQEAKAAEINDADAVALATATPDGRPSVRMVLLKGHGPDGFTFYTNADSRKGDELAANPQAALLFHWKSLAARCGSRVPSTRLARRKPTPISPHGAGIRSSAPAPRSSRGRSIAGRRSKRAMKR